jgi:hypothetical protein
VVTSIWVRTSPGSPASIEKTDVRMRTLNMAHPEMTIAHLTTASCTTLAPNLSRNHGGEHLGKMHTTTRGRRHKGVSQHHTVVYAFVCVVRCACRDDVSVFFLCLCCGYSPEILHKRRDFKQTKSKMATPSTRVPP